jgi:multiple sugar transport system ATP-binding protein
MATVELRGVTKRFGESIAVRDVSFTVNHGEFVVCVGPSGCGKTTVLRMIAGLEEISDGVIWIDGVRANELAPAARGIAMVFQSYALYPHMTVHQNMGFGLKLAGVPRAEINVAVRQAAKVLHIEALLERYPAELSGGQRQRVAIGRAITRKPKVFLFDEPLSNVDAELRVRMRVEFARLHRELGATMIYVTHDQVEAMTLADRIAVFSTGKIEQIGEPLELYHRPTNRFVAGFIGSPRMNFLEGKLVERSQEGATVELRNGSRIAASVNVDRLSNDSKTGNLVTLGVRPENLELDGRGINSLPAILRQIEHTGDATLLYADVCDGADGTDASLEGPRENLIARLPGAVMRKPGELIRIGIPRKACHVFDTDGVAMPRLG